MWTIIIGYLFGWDQYGDWRGDPYYQEDGWDDMDWFDWL